MSKGNRKQTFLGGAAVLALATAIVKVIGACYKIPLQQVIGIDGYGYFTTAYDIYSVLLMISTTGLPVAMSRMISEASTLGRTNQIKRVYRVSLYAFLAPGIIGAGGMLFLCRQLAAMMGQPEAWFAIACLAPAVLFISLISAFRGFFQGQSNMVPTSMSQIIEAVCKLFVGLAAAYLIGKKTGSIIYAAGGAILGVTLGTVVGAAYLGIKYRGASRELPKSCPDPTVYSHRSTLKTLLSIAIPITLGATGMQLISVVDAAVLMHRLKGAAGFAAEQANLAKGIYNFTQTIFNLPCAFITPLTVSVIPAITEHLTLKNRRGARMVEESSLRVMSLIAMPCAIGLAVLSGPILQLLGGSGYTGETLKTGSVLLSILGVAVILNSFVLVVNAIMQAHGYVYLPVINMLIGGIVKIIVNFFLIGIPSINVVGAPIGTLACYLTITALNIFTMHRVLKKPPRLVSNLFKPLMASLLMGAAAWVSNSLLLKTGLSASICCLAAIAVAGIVYIILVYAMRIITLDDCRLLPKGDKIAKILRIH